MVVLGSEHMMYIFSNIISGGVLSTLLGFLLFVKACGFGYGVIRVDNWIRH